MEGFRGPRQRVRGAERDRERQVEASGRITFGKCVYTIVYLYMYTYALHDLFERQMLTPEDFWGYSFELEAGWEVLRIPRSERPEEVAEKYPGLQS